MNSLRPMMGEGDLPASLSSLFDGKDLGNLVSSFVDDLGASDNPIIDGIMDGVKEIAGDKKNHKNDGLDVDDVLGFVGQMFKK